MKFVTLTKLDGLPTVINLDHLLVLFPNGADTRVVLSNGMDIYVKGAIAEVQKQIESAAANP